MDEGDEFGDLYADLDEQVNAGITTVNSSSESTVKESKSNGCEPDNRSKFLVDDADVALDLGDGIQSDDYTSESEDDLFIVLNENERVDSTNGKIGGKEEDFGIGNGLADHERCEPVGFKGNWSMLRYGQGDWDRFRFPYFGGLTDAVQNGFNFFLPRNCTIFYVNIEELDYKPWRNEGANISDYFNFDLNEDSWKIYCQDLHLLRDKDIMLNWVRHDRPASVDKEISKEPEKPKGRAILVRSDFGERLPSTDIWRPPTERDSNVVIHINMAGSMEDENCLDTIEDKNTEAEEGEFESTLMEHENETIERCFGLQKDDTYYGLDTDSMLYSYSEKEEREIQIAKMDPDSCSEESVEECKFKGVYSSSEQKAKFQSTRCSSSRTEADKESEVLKPGKDRDGKNRSLIEECHDRYTYVGYRSSWRTVKHGSLRCNSKKLSTKEQQRDQLFVRQLAVPSAPWHEKEDRPPFGIRRYHYMGVQDPRSPTSEIRGRYGCSTAGNMKYKTRGYMGHLEGRRHHFKQTTVCKENIPSQEGHYRQNFICGHSYTEDEFVLSTVKERCDEWRYNWPVNRRFNSFHKGFVKRGSCYGRISRNVATNKPYMNSKRWYGIDGLVEGNNGICTFVDLRKRSYIADSCEERDCDLLALRHKKAVNIRFGDDRKKLPRKDYEISGEECSQQIKRSTNCTADVQDRNPRISRFERHLPYRAGLNTISRVGRNGDSEKAVWTDKIGEREKGFSEKILEAIIKMQKRGERFKESAFMKKGDQESEKKALREVEADPVANDGNHLRPVRKRRWGCR